MYTPLVAAAATLSIVPFTFIFMGGVNGRLLEQVERLTLGEGEIRELVKRWAELNLLRGVEPVVGACVGFWGAL